MQERNPRFTSLSGLDSNRVYPRDDLKNWSPGHDLGQPGEFPSARDIYPTMYRGQLWTMRQCAGFGSADDTNRRFTYLHQHGQTGLSVAFDLPILMGIAADDSRAHGEVGHCGVAISSLADMDRLFADIPLDLGTTSMTIHGPATVISAMDLAVADKRGISFERVGGSLLNDIRKEYIAGKNGPSHLNPHCGSSPTLSPPVRNRLLNGIRSVSVDRGLSLSKAVEPRETCGVTGRERSGGNRQCSRIA